MDTMALPLILLHVIDCLRDNTAGDIQVPCSDTKVFILLMDLAATGHLVALNMLIVVTGTNQER